MAQSKVTSYFNTTKTAQHGHPSKKRKAIDACLLFDRTVETSQSSLTTSDEGLIHENITQSTKRQPTRRSKRSTVAKTNQSQVVQRKSGSSSKQLSIHESLSRSKTKATLPIAASSTKFDFQLKPTHTVSHISIVTECQDDSLSPSSSPKKRTSNPVPENNESKRKRRVRQDVLSTVALTPSQGELTEIVSKSHRSVKKKLQLSAGDCDANEAEPGKLDRDISSLTTQHDAQPIENPKASRSPRKSINNVTKMQCKTGKSSKTEILLPASESVSSKLVKSNSSPHSSTNEATKTKEPKIPESKPSGESNPSMGKSKLSTTEMKALLKRCGKLDQLKACLKNVEELTKAKPPKVTRPKEEITREKVNVSTMGEEETPKSSGEEETSRSSVVPAYERYKDLATKIPPTLTLPFKYKLLEDMFKGTDTIVSILHNRLERCTFSKLKQAVEDMVRRTFEPKHLGQIKTVYPESYNISHEKGLIEMGRKVSRYQMVIEPNLAVDENDKKIARRKDGKPTFTSSEVMRRKQHFKHRLFEIVKSHHQDFLSKLSTPIQVEPDKLNRWHPRFLVDDTPDVPVAELPAPPAAAQSAPSQTAQEVLEACRDKVPSRVEQALQKVAAANKLAAKCKAKVEAKLVAPSSMLAKGYEVKPATPASSGISSSLLERIRAKEALKAQAAMLRDADSETELEILGRLPDMVKIIRSCFVTEKKAALPEDVVVVKLCDSYKSAVSQGSVEKIITYILKILPAWMRRVEVSSGTYLRLDREMDLSLLNKRVEQLIKQKQYI